MDNDKRPNGLPLSRRPARIAPAQTPTISRAAGGRLHAQSVGPQVAFV